ncbi:MAG TPA: NADH-quinone oxidoreductase subunit NuoN [Hyphomicrobiaceae bacterium]|nr:NADH-quinone oxidoreductase subunit NuoN [Hyphomicrobiaceae bacterium]
MTLIGAYAALWPEIVVCLGAMALLMYGVFRPESDREAETAGWLAVLVLVFAAVLVLQQPEEPQRLFGDAFIADGFGRFMKLLVLAGSALALILAFDEFKADRIMRFEYPALVLLATAGMMMMVSAGDLIALYLGLELQSLALYVVAAFRREDVRSSEAGLKYFVLGALSSGMLLYGASLLYGFTGQVSFEAIAAVARAATVAENVGITIGLVFLLVGIAFKVSAVPFHMWTPDVYEGAPTPVTAFFSAAPKIAAMALLVRVVLSAFPGIAEQWQQIVVFLAIASMLLGAFAAIGQSNIKRLMAYSSIANIGFALVGLIANSPEGTQGVLIYMAIYLAMTLGSFACIQSMRRETGSVEAIDELSGLAVTHPSMAFVFALMMFSLAGIPPLAGFWAKYFVFLPAMKAGFYTVAVIGVLASVVAAYYYLRIVKIMYFDAPKEKFLPVRVKAGVVMALTASFVLLYVLFPSPLFEAASVAAGTFRY